MPFSQGFYALVAGVLNVCSVSKACVTLLEAAVGPTALLTHSCPGRTTCGCQHIHVYMILVCEDPADCACVHGRLPGQRRTAVLSSDVDSCFACLC